MKIILKAIWDWLWGIPAEEPPAPQPPAAPNVVPIPSAPPAPVLPSASVPLAPVQAPIQVSSVRPWTDVATPRVIDVSHWQGSIDFSKVAAAAGFWGVICKATEGTTGIDATFATNIKNAREAGLLAGAYHFLHHGDGAAQAKHFLEVTGAEKDAALLMAADFEPTTPSPTLQDLQDFLTAVHTATGRWPILYSGNLIKELLPKAAEAATFLAPVRLWLAQYSTKPSWPSLWKSPWLWQCSEHGKVPGIPADDTDINSFNGTRDDLMREWTA